LGPKSGPQGGNVIVQGDKKKIKNSKSSLTRELIE